MNDWGWRQSHSHEGKRGEESVIDDRDIALSSLGSSNSMKTPSPRDQLVVFEHGNGLEREWQKFLEQWNQPILRMTVAECMPDLVGILWHKEFVELTTSIDFHDINITAIDKDAILATQRLIHAVLSRTRISAAALLLALFFAHRYRCNLKVLETSGSQYRMFLVSLILAHKYTEDHPFSNRVWAQLAELPIDHINGIERDFLQHIEHRLAVRIIDFQRWVVALDRRFGWTFATCRRGQDYRTLPLPLTPEVSIINSPSPVKVRDTFSRHNSRMQPTVPATATRKDNTVFTL